MTTCIQTITIEMPNYPYVFHGMEQAPICPPSYAPEGKNEFIVMKTLDNSIITWWKNKTIVKVSPDGTTKFWNPKPDLKTAVKMCANASVFFQFNKDLSVVYSVGDTQYYWSGPVQGTPEVGEQVVGYDYENGPDEDISDADSVS